MSYSTYVYAVDLDALRRAVEEHDTSILKLIRKKHRDEWETKLLDDDPTTGEALEQIIAGQNLDPAHAHQYGYALKMLCQHFGKMQDLPGLEYCQINSPLESSRLPIHIPYDESQFPRISYLTASETKAEADRLASVDLSSAKNREVAEMRRWYFECIQQAANAGKAVVTFYH